MINILKKFLFRYERPKHNWVVEVEKETFLFKNESQEEVRKLLTVNKIIDNLLETMLDKDASELANQWIDSENVHIRENNNFDCTIDYLLNPAPDQPMPPIEEGQPAFATATNYIKNAVPTNEQMDQKLAVLKDRIDNELLELMGKSANQKGGIALAMDILGAINDQNNAFLLEMRDEEKIMVSINLPKEEQDLHDRCALLAEGGNLMNTKDSLLKKVCKEAEDIVKCKREILRREYATKFFKWLQTRIQSWFYIIRQAATALDYVRQSNNIELVQHITEAKDGIILGPKDLALSNFLDSLESKNILVLCKQTPAEIQAVLESYVEKNIND